MLEKLFKYPAVLTRHKNAPFFEERDRYLVHREKEGCAHETLLRIAHVNFSGWFRCSPFPPPQG